jgi:hypothetical protein
VFAPAAAAGAAAARVAPRPSRRTAITLGLGLAALLTALLVVEVLPYAGEADATPFLLEKGARAQDPIWRLGFFVHVTGGVACLVTALPLFSRRLLASRPGLHRALGWAYVSAVLLALVPGGLVLIPAAKGGVVGQAGFAVQALWLAVTTGAGLARVLARDFVRHRAWMVRSYLMAATALTFRVIFVALQAAGVERAYELSIWASFGSSVVLAEAWISSLAPRRIP